MIREQRGLDAQLVLDRPLWVIIDATPTTLIPKRLAQADVESVSLYKGEAEEKYWDIAPYLARLDIPLFSWIQETLWDRPWGIVLTSEGSLEDLRKHFRQFLLVRDSHGQKLYFRFYDPRVLAAYLPTCRDDELDEFFGPVEEFWARTPDGDPFNVFRRSEKAKPREEPAPGRGGR